MLVNHWISVNVYILDIQYDFGHKWPQRYSTKYSLSIHTHILCSPHHPKKSYSSPIQISLCSWIYSILVFLLLCCCIVFHSKSLPKYLLTCTRTRSGKFDNEIREFSTPWPRHLRSLIGYYQTCVADSETLNAASNPLITSGIDCQNHFQNWVLDPSDLLKWITKYNGPDQFGLIM